MNTDPGSIFKGFFVELWPFLAVEFWSRCWILTPSWVAIPRVEDMQAGQNSTLNCDPGSKFHVDLWPRDKFSRWIMTPGQNSILNFDPNSRSEFNVESWIGVTIQRWIQTWGYNLTLNQELGSIFNVEYWPGSDFNVESWPGSQFNMELKPRIKIPHWIMTPGQNSTLNCDPNPGSQFNVESRLRVIIQRGNKTRGHNSMGVQILSVGGVVKQWPPVSGGRNSSWKIRWILSTTHWIKTPRVEIQWGQNSILHRLTSLAILKQWYSYPTLNTFTYNV